MIRISPDTKVNYDMLKQNVEKLAEKHFATAKGVSKLIFSCDTESCGANPRSVGFRVILITESNEGEFTAYGTVLSDFLVNILPKGVTTANHEECRLADSKVHDGARTLKEFWEKDDNMKSVYKKLNTTSVIIEEAVMHILKYVDVFSFLNLPGFVAARPLAYDACVLNKIFEKTQQRNPFGIMGSSSGLDYSQLIAAQESPNSIYTPVQFAKYLQKVGIKELEHNALRDAIDQFNAYWEFKKSKHPGVHDLVTYVR